MIGAWARRLASRPGSVQAAYYVASGLWPLLSYRTFERVTGPKREVWLVKLIGLITVVIGGVLAMDPAGRARQTRVLALGGAAAYMAVEIWYAGVRRRIRTVYLLDAIAEAALVAAWLSRPGR